MQSLGETNSGGFGPPKPNESKNCHWPAPFACVTNALKAQMFGGVVPGEGDGETKIGLCAKRENSVPVPLLLRLKENCCGVVPKTNQAGGMCGLLGLLRSCTASARA